MVGGHPIRTSSTDLTIHSGAIVVYKYIIHNIELTQDVAAPKGVIQFLAIVSMCKDVSLTILASGTKLQESRSLSACTNAEHSQVC